MLRKTLGIVGLALLTVSCTTAQVRAEPGTLVIVGGGLEPDNHEVFAAFLGARPPHAPVIAIIPAASGEASRSAEAFRQTLIAHGAEADDIEMVSLAAVDDPTTQDVDESRWAQNAKNEEEIARIARAGAIWFTGGDQSRITDLLLDPEGRDTPMLTAIRARLADGAAVGGTSAGAAIMSDPMITQGDALSALLPQGTGEPLRTGRGLGFVDGLIVDQHFGERARLGRLAAALFQEGQPHTIGAGIDENTALVLRHGNSMARVLGAGYVTFVDARAARVGSGDRFAAHGLNLSLAARGDTIDLASGAVAPASFKSGTVGNEYHDRPSINGGGMAIAASSLADVAGEGLLDNSASRVVERQSFSEGYGVTYRFIQNDASRGWWGRDADGSASYAFEKVGFDIEPIDVIVTRAGN